MPSPRPDEGRLGRNDRVDVRAGYQRRPTGAVGCVLIGSLRGGRPHCVGLAGFERGGGQQPFHSEVNVSRRSDRRRREFDDDFDDDVRSYRAPPRAPAHMAADALFNPAVPRPAAVEQAPPVKARVKFFNAAKKFGILRTVEGAEFFLPGRVLPPDIGEEQLRPATEVVVRVAPDKGDLPAVTEVVEIKPAALRTERGTVVKWDGRWGFVELDCGGQWVHLAARVVAEAGIVPVVGDRIEVDVTITHKPAAVAARAI